MGATNRTDHYDLSQFKGTDKPSWLLDYNGDMSKIDTALYNAADTAAQAADAINEDITPAVDTLKTDVQTLTTQSGAISERVGTAETNITSLTTRANTADNNIAVLATDKQNKALSAPVLIDGVPYSSVEDALRAIAVHGGGDLNEYQKKNLTTPVVIDGTTYTTVEAAINALNMSGGGGGTVVLPGSEVNRERVINWQVPIPTSGYIDYWYTAANDGYYNVNGHGMANTGKTFNGSFNAYVYDHENGTILYPIFETSTVDPATGASAVQTFNTGLSALYYLKAGQAIRLNVLYTVTASGDAFACYMEIYYTPGIAVNNGGSGGDLSAYQTKVLTTPIDVDGVQYTTVESAMAAINALAAAGGGGGTGTTNYNVLLNKPKINGVELTGDKSSADLHIEGGGTSDYAELTNKPQINGVTLAGNKTAADLGISGVATYIQNNPTHSESTSHWNEWQGGDSSALTVNWTCDNNCCAYAVIRMARGSAVNVIMIGGSVSFSPSMRFNYPHFEETTTTIDTGDYRDVLIPLGVYAKGVSCGISVQGDPSISKYKVKIFEVDMT